MDLSNITVNTQSSIRIAGSQILYFDPFQIDGKVQDADVIFVTHEHGDHFDPSSIAGIRKEGTILAAPESMKQKILDESGARPGSCVFMRPGDTCSIGGITVEAVPAYNRLKPFHQKKRGWLGYRVCMDGVTYYVAGDTDPVSEVRQVKSDVVLLPVGGYYTMDWKDAAQLILQMRPAAAIPTHYGTIVGSPGDGESFREKVRAGNPDIQVELKLQS